MNEPLEHNGFRLQIDRLVLKGISYTHYQRHQLREAVHAELVEQFSKAGIPDQVRNLPAKIRTGPIEVATGKPDPIELGRQIGAKIFNSISGGQPDNEGTIKK